jgi:hypothetical protein
MCLGNNTNYNRRGKELSNNNIKSKQQLKGIKEMAKLCYNRIINQ